MFYYVGIELYYRYTDGCKYNKYFTLNIDYFEEKDEFSLSCLKKRRKYNIFCFF